MIRIPIAWRVDGSPIMAEVQMTAPITPQRLWQLARILEKLALVADQPLDEGDEEEAAALQEAAAPG